MTTNNHFRGKAVTAPLQYPRPANSAITLALVLPASDNSSRLQRLAPCLRPCEFLVITRHIDVSL
jgi:hypothetical protein